MTIRLADRTRAYVVVYTTACCAFLVVFGSAAIAHGSVTGMLVALAAICAFAAAAWRFVTMQVRVQGDELTVRGFASSRTIARRDIEGFTVGGRPSQTPGIAVLVKARDGTSVSLSATGWYFRSREDIEFLRSALEEWRVTQRQDADLGPD